MGDVVARPEVNDDAGWPRPSWPALLVVGLISRVLVVALGIALADPEPPRMRQFIAKHDAVVARDNLGYQARHRAGLSRMEGLRRLVRPWYAFDAIWYAEVSLRGYNFEPGRQSTTGFMPLLPLLMAAGAAVGLDRYAVGLIAPNLAFPLGLACFGRAVLRVTGDAGATWRTCLLLLAYPYSFFYSAPYQEALAFALLSAAILAWQARRPVAAGAALAVGALSRMSAAPMMAGALVVEWADDLVRRRPARPTAWLVAAAGAAGFGAFLLYLGYRCGDPLVAIKSHAAWERQPANPVNVLRVLGDLGWNALHSPATAFYVALVLAWLLQGAIGRALGRTAASRTGAAGGRGGAGRALMAAVVVLVAGVVLLASPGRVPAPIAYLLRVLDIQKNYLCALALLGLGIHAWAVRGPFWGCLVLIPTLQALATGTPMSMTRLVLSAFPAFLDAQDLLRNRVAFAAVVAACLVLQVDAINRFVNWDFVG
jgi:hypothetical protein